MKRYTTSTLSVLAWALATAAVLAPVSVFAAGPTPVDLLSAGNFTVLSKTGITNTGSHASVMTGNIGSSPITAAAMSGVFCSEMTGTIYGVDAAYVGSGNQTCFAGAPPSANKTLVDNAVLDMGTAYADATGRTNPTATELGAGNIGGMTLAPSLYKWSTDVTIPTSVTLSGGPNDVWIFQIAGNLAVASAGSVPAGVKVLLAGGANPANIFWQVGGITGATLGTYSTFNGNILSAKQVIIQTGAVLNGRALAQTDVTLDSNPVTIPTAQTPGTLAVTSITPIQTSSAADNTFSDGWSYLFNITVPTGEPNLSMEFANWLNTVTPDMIGAANNIEISSAQAASTAPVLLTASNTYSAPALNMTGDLSTTTPGRQVQVLVQMKIPLNSVQGSYATSYGVQTLR